MLLLKGLPVKRLVSLALGAALLASSAVFAAPLVSYTHNYGNGAGQYDPVGTDALSNGYVTVSDQSTGRFSDAFNFSGLNYASIDSFDLTLTYSRTNNNLLGIPLELWFARPGGTPDQFFSFFLAPVGNTSSSLTFRIDSSLDPEFGQMVAAEEFFFWFAEETPNLLIRDEFRLHSAKLDVNGTVPEPGSMALIGLGLAGLGFMRRREKR